MNDQAKVIELLTAVYPKTLSVTTLMKDLHHHRPFVDNALSALMTAGRVTAHRINVTSCVYRLSESEALAQGFAKENPVKGRDDRLDARPIYTPKPMQPVRPEAQQAVQIMSRRGDSFVPFQPPMGIASSVRGGA